MIGEDIEEEGACQIKHNGDTDPKQVVFIQTLGLGVFELLVEIEDDVDENKNRFNTYRYTVKRPEFNGGVI